MNVNGLWLLTYTGKSMDKLLQLPFSPLEEVWCLCVVEDDVMPM